MQNIKWHTQEKVVYSPICKRFKVQGLSKSRLTIRGTKLGTLSPLLGFGQCPSCSPHRLDSRSAVLKEKYIGPSTRHIVLSVIPVSYRQRQRRFTMFVFLIIINYMYKKTKRKRSDSVL